MGNYSYAACKVDYTEHWSHTVINHNRVQEFKNAATKIIGGASVYKSLESQTGIPWYFIGLLHFRESDCNFHTHLHNGDSLNARTHQVPAGRPKKAPASGHFPYTFNESALDALEDYKGQDWTKETIEKIAYNSEKFNGFGYRAHGVPSAYLWAGTNQYKRGKYVADGVWSSTYVDTQLGCMGILKTLLETDKSVVATTSAPAVTVPVVINTPKAQIDTPTNAQMKSVSRKYWYNDLMQKIMGALGLGGATYKGLDSLNLETTKSSIETIKSIAETIGSIGLVVGAVCLGAYFIYQNRLIKEDIVEGRLTPSGGDVVPNDAPNNPAEIIVPDTSV